MAVLLALIAALRAKPFNFSVKTLLLGSVLATLRMTVLAPSVKSKGRPVVVARCVFAILLSCEYCVMLVIVFKLAAFTSVNKNPSVLAFADPRKFLNLFSKP